ncbi:hypothetical protein BDV35DRAFT_401606 [Aspergillus flavus]|uniref:DNA, SC020 n=3 Tax=Aspergillus subgen. Circumdati TaxID=2720871 RepID=Q2U447_ASPOR|nr:unnamed protein product [Aspergillus oryzae RIB40]EIT76497.1 hypothetical protein Ao3042_07500 [Aspergillus oryzae 3.042]KAB8250176.1 hypothetical protein BDV35DRAFT_401606 [Aspergillus flavus]KDE85176.1 hypothetical protein AO1008_00535 [Aspergillus oryzae 100-8]KOC08799.1 hypothetical protein AFLA70_180g002172 [Aspergillus flavus AF70]BAE63668.1 unnamed protein product [Aspergillus oryzae RIB40]|eukprot:EIT76497.1 hypothetical protein Ao3042_07500 [Aspergillus oryzae 3.042]
MGVLEDKLNKASRPIPAGLISYQQGQRRWIIAWLFFPAFAFLIGGPKQQQSLYYGRPRSLGFILLQKLIGSSVESFPPEAPLTTFSHDILFIFFVTTTPIQEFHDVMGDQQAGRRTLPPILSTKQLDMLRKVTALIILV